MRTKTKINEEWAYELKRIRKKYKMSKTIFGLFLGRTRICVNMYESKKLGISEKIIERARYIDKVFGELINVR